MCDTPDFLNSIHPKIKFTMEVESQHKINFLDLTISHSSNKHEFSIFRKPTQTDNIIPNNSTHPWSHKLSVFHSWLWRLVKVPLNKKDFQEELATIRNIAVANGYDVELIKRLLKVKLRNNCINKVFPQIPANNEEITRVTIPYIGLISDKVGSILRKGGFSVAFKNKPLLSKVFSCTKDKLNPMDTSGVYELKCSDCNAVYVGQTGRSFKCRIKEHMRVWKTGNGESHFAKHLRDCRHNFDPEKDVRILHRTEKGALLNVLENLEISLSRRDNNDDNLNEQIQLRGIYLTDMLVKEKII
jgi:hypothetical protein